MPSSLFASFNINYKSFKLTALLLLSPLFFFAQSLTGLWTGVLTNDSNSVRKDQSFEIVLTEYRGKVYGYSRSEFIVNDTLYYIVKRVKGAINGDTCEVKDDDILSYNFPTRLDKGIKVSSTFYRNKKDSAWYLAGTWKTNKTKTYYSVTGKIDMKEEKDLTTSKIFPHLEELNLANDVAFYKDRKKEQGSYIVKTIEPENKKSEITIKEDQAGTIKDNVVITTGINSKLIEDPSVNITSKKPAEIIPITQAIVNTPSEQVKTIPVSTIQDLSKNTVPQKQIESTNREKIKTIPNTVTQDIAKTNDSQKQEPFSSTNKIDLATANIESKQVSEKQIESTNREDIKTIPNTVTQGIAQTNDSQKQEPVSPANKKDIAIANVESKQVSEKQIESTNKENIKTTPNTLTHDIVKINDSQKQETVSPTNKKDLAIANVESKQVSEKQIESTNKENIKTTPNALTHDIVKINDSQKQETISSTNKKDISIANVESMRVPKKQIESFKREEMKTTSNTLTQDLTKINETKKQEAVFQTNKKETVTTKTEQPVISKVPAVADNNSNTKNIAKTAAIITPTSVKQTNAEIKTLEAAAIMPINSKVITLANPADEKKEMKNDAVVVITKTENKNEIADAGIAAILIKERKSEFSQVVNFKSDSLELSLYDNGEIDGDTVTVLLNGEIILAKQCLKASAIKKTIYITPGNAEFTMLLYAENLGKYPPNTGMLVVHDGDDVYNVRFSADFQKNAGVVFRRKK